MKTFLAGAVTAGLLAVVLAGMAVPALAHEGEKSMKATDLIRQGIAFIVTTPDAPDKALDKMNDALNSTDQAGAFIPYVKDAITAEKAGAYHKARALLEASIGAKPHMSGIEPAPIRQLSEQTSATGADTGAGVAIDPLAAVFEFNPSNLVVIGISVALVLIGGLMAYKMRPQHSKGAQT